ncbi:MAG TPA: 6-carboxytetrahydropterin synthase QueD [Pyrinomonadaceae bacterium]|jgi:6-pyruvoyltetrahydropterin/6-carboxytetrahydropterin synthase|nr:6-carboxytetrahydropterin synthase QueD [Pyrinomonadaceae bacterium]
MEIFKRFKIEAAHRLPNVPPGHKCERLHGHSYGVVIHVSGPVGTPSGWVIDFADIEKAFLPVFEHLDHQYLNEVDGLSNPTSENIARWIWDKLQPSLPNLSKVVILETRASGCIYQGPD